MFLLKKKIFAREFICVVQVVSELDDVCVDTPNAARLYVESVLSLWTRDMPTPFTAMALCLPA
jgi:hypothetical protein